MNAAGTKGRGVMQGCWFAAETLFLGTIGDSRDKRGTALVDWFVDTCAAPLPCVFNMYAKCKGKMRVRKLSPGVGLERNRNRRGF